MNGKNLNEFELPKEIKQKERKRANKLIILAMLLSNGALYLVLSTNQPTVTISQKAESAARDGHTFIRLPVQKFIASNDDNQHVTIMRHNKIIANNCILKNCNGETCDIEVPNLKIKELMTEETHPLKVVPYIQISGYTKSGNIYEINI